MKTKTNILMDKEKMELISEYATAAIFLYGVISLEEFVDVFNFYEQADITATEVGPALHEMAKNDDVEYSFYNNILSEPELQPGFHNYEHNVSSIRYSQKGKPRYLPKKSEFLRYVDWEYREPKAPYVKLKKYILKHKLKNRDGKPGDIEEDLIELHWMIRFGIDTKNCMDYFTRTGYEFNSIDEAKEFMQLVIVANNNTRIYENNGYTPSELSKKENRLKPRPLEGSTNLEDIPKVGRNDPCPCGSGVKYKRCHG